MTLYDDILNQTRRLTPDEQLRLIAYLSEQTRLARTQESTEPKRWEDMRGAAPYPFIAEDAQEWVFNFLVSKMIVTEAADHES